MSGSMLKSPASQLTSRPSTPARLQRHGRAMRRGALGRPAPGFLHIPAHHVDLRLPTPSNAEAECFYTSRGGQVRAFCNGRVSIPGSRAVEKIAAVTRAALYNCPEACAHSCWPSPHSTPPQCSVSCYRHELKTLDPFLTRNCNSEYRTSRSCRGG